MSASVPSKIVIVQCFSNEPLVSMSRGNGCRARLLCISEAEAWLRLGIGWPTCDHAAKPLSCPGQNWGARLCVQEHMRGMEPPAAFPVDQSAF